MSEIDLTTIGLSAIAAGFVKPTAEYFGKQALEKAQDVIKKARALLADSGQEPNPVESKIFFPLMQSASQEEAPVLTDMWAALLANAANPEKRINVQLPFVEVLKQLQPADTLVLNSIYFPRGTEKGISQVDAIAEREAMLMFPPHDGQFVIDNLIRLGLCKQYRDVIGSTEFGYRFMLACSPPGTIEGAFHPR